MSDLFSAQGQDVNPAKIGGVTELLGGPSIRPEKPYTIVRGPGFHIAIARTTDDNYWIHVAVRTEDGAPRSGRVIKARIDFDGRYGAEANATLMREIEAGDVQHIAFLVEPWRRS